MVEFKSRSSWNNLKNRIQKGQRITGVVIRSEVFGVFIDIGEPFEGLVLTPYMSRKLKNGLEDYPKIGEVITGTVLDFSSGNDLQNAYVSISLKE